MNLGQSVAVCLYELVRAVPEPPPPPAEQAAAGAVEAAVQLSLEILRLADFVLPGNEPDLTRRVRAALLKYNLSKYDTDMLCGILRKIEAKIRPSTQTHVGELKQ
jgi:tRNA C32,U32 (ribose-2'-O)-methylase TrmJ